MNRAELTAGGVIINRDTPCTSDNWVGCTSVSGLPDYTVDYLVALNQAIRQQYPDYNLILTGGSETHGSQSAHGDGRSVVDLQYQQGDALDTYVHANGGAGVDRTWATQYTVNNPDGSVTNFYDEAGGTAHHWHVEYTPAS
jgi:hypothetical protein